MGSSDESPDSLSSCKLVDPEVSHKIHYVYVIINID